jgi:hypothetical protein
VSVKLRARLGNQPFLGGFPQERFTADVKDAFRSLFELEPGNHLAMNIPRLIAAIVVGFLVIFGTDYLIHQVWMAPDYLATQQLWRPESEMTVHFGWMLFAQLLLVFAFVMLWTRWAGTARIGCAIGYGFLMGLFSGVWPIILYVVIPMPCAIACKWFFAGIIQCILLGLVTFFVYKPKPSSAVG